MTKHTIPEICGSSNTSCKAPAPVAKPIVWEKVQLVEFGKIGKFQIQVYEAWENNKPEEKELPFIFDIYYGDYHSNAYITLECVKRFLTMEEAKQAAQDWLNKLVADMSIASTCPENVSKNGEDLKVSDSTGLNPSISSGLKSNCTEKSDSSTPQFTAEEIDGIRKLAQFSGFMIANSIIAKCEAMLEGVQE